MAETYKKNSITLPAAVAMGTGVMIGAGIFALTGQIAELAGPLFPLSFVVGAVVFSAYTYIKMSNALRSWFSPEKTRAILAGKREILGYPLAALLGVLTPFCSCSSALSPQASRWA